MGNSVTLNLVAMIAAALFLAMVLYKKFYPQESQSPPIVQSNHHAVGERIFREWELSSRKDISGSVYVRRRSLPLSYTIWILQRRSFSGEDTSKPIFQVEVLRGEPTSMFMTYCRRPSSKPIPFSTTDEGAIKHVISEGDQEMKTICSPSLQPVA